MSTESSALVPEGGKKTEAERRQVIGVWGSWVLNVNNIMGPGMVALPLAYQQSGWLIPTIVLFTAFVLSSFSATMLCEAMQKIPGNADFGMRFEFATTVRHYWGGHPVPSCFARAAKLAGARGWSALSSAMAAAHEFCQNGAYYVAQILVNVCLQSLNVASIIVGAQVMDEFFVFAFGKTMGLRYWWLPGDSPFEATPGVAWHRADHGVPMAIVATPDAMWDSDPYVLSAGFVVCLFICLPFGALNLDENMSFQNFSLVLLLITTGGFVWQFLQLPIHPEWCPAVRSDNITKAKASHGGEDPNFMESVMQNQAIVLGIVVFSYAFVITVPSWVNAKVNNVSVNAAIWSSTATGFVMKLCVGLLAALTYPPIFEANILNEMNMIHHPSQTPSIRTVNRVFIYLFNLGTIVPGIPVFSILVKNNLLFIREVKDPATGVVVVKGKDGLFGPAASNFLGNIAPWLLSAFLYHGSGFASLINWTAVLFQGFVNFVIPAALYLTALRTAGRPLFARSHGSGRGAGGEGASLTDDDAGADLDLGPSVVENGDASLASWAQEDAQWNYPSGADEDDAEARKSPGLGGLGGSSTSLDGGVGDVGGVEGYGAAGIGLGGSAGQVLFPEWMEDADGAVGGLDLGAGERGCLSSMCYAPTVHAVPRWLDALLPCRSTRAGGPCSCGCVVGWTTLGVMTALTVATLALDVFFLFRGVDLVDNPGTS